jgi:hypothetical protein
MVNKSLDAANAIRTGNNVSLTLPVSMVVEQYPAEVVNRLAHP